MKSLFRTDLAQYLFLLSTVNVPAYLSNPPLALPLRLKRFSPLCSAHVAGIDPAYFSLSLMFKHYFISIILLSPF